EPTTLSPWTPRATGGRGARPGGPPSGGDGSGAQRGEDLVHGPPELSHRVPAREPEDGQGAAGVGEAPDPLGDLLWRAGDEAPAEVVLGKHPEVVRLVEASGLVEGARARVLDVHVEVDHRGRGQGVAPGRPGVLPEAPPPRAELLGRRHLTCQP